MSLNKLTTGAPPKREPNPKGLNIPPKRVTVVRLEKINGRNRQSSSKRRANNKNA